MIDGRGVSVGRLVVDANVGIGGATISTDERVGDSGMATVDSVDCSTDDSVLSAVGSSDVSTVDSEDGSVVVSVESASRVSVVLSD